MADSAMARLLLNMIVSILALSVGALAHAQLEPQAAPLSKRLEKIHSKILTDYDNVAHISATEFSALDASSTVVFDIREEREYAVSHISGAVRVDPSTKPQTFINQHRSAFKDKTVVFYCSVGRRSSRFASQVSGLVSEHGAHDSYNLTGGLFHWHNARQPLTSAGQPTDAIHPFNFYWGRLIEDRSGLSYKPVPYKSQ